MGTLLKNGKRILDGQMPLAALTLSNPLRRSDKGRRVAIQARLRIIGTIYVSGIGSQESPP